MGLGGVHLGPHLVVGQEARLWRKAEMVGGQGERRTRKQGGPEAEAGGVQ